MAQDFRSDPYAGHSTPPMTRSQAGHSAQYAAHETPFQTPRAQSYHENHADPYAEPYAEHVHFAPQSQAASDGYATPHSGYQDAGYHAASQTQMTGQDDGAHRPRLGAAQWSGALVSLALICGMGVWGYKLMVRDVSGVPVIRAIEGSARLVPEDPGGQLAMHQGLAVNSVTADGSAAPPADRLALAPDTTGLTDEDQPIAEAEPMLTALETPEAPEAVAEDMETLMVEADPLELDDVQEVSAPVDATGVVRSPVPIARPIRLASRATVNDSPSLDGVAGDILAALGGVTEMEPGEVPAGSRLVQFGAYQSADVARSEWGRLSNRFEELMEGKSRVIERAESGGTVFYRLRAYGFADASDANRFCAALTAMNAACVPTVQR
nr:SPOR domain-containing protein [uncultured Celeribacter sp.]